MKPGYKTSEFWLVALSNLMIWLQGGGLAPGDLPAEPIAALAASAVTVGAYCISRGKAKSAAEK